MVLIRSWIYFILCYICFIKSKSDFRNFRTISVLLVMGHESYFSSMLYVAFSLVKLLTVSCFLIRLIIFFFLEVDSSSYLIIGLWEAWVPWFAPFLSHTVHSPLTYSISFQLQVKLFSLYLTWEDIDNHESGTYSMEQLVKCSNIPAITQKFYYVVHWLARLANEKNTWFVKTTNYA